MIAKVTINIPHHAVDKSFDYKVPRECSEVQVGIRVEVHFNHRKHVGMITGFKKTSTQKNLKSILKIIDEKPLISEQSLKLAENLRTFYALPLFDYLNLMIPAPLKKPLKTKRQTVKNPKSVKETDKSVRELSPESMQLEKSLQRYSKAILDNGPKSHDVLIDFLSKQENKRILIIHPDILSAEVFHEKIKFHLNQVVLYHSKLKISEKRRSLQALDDNQTIMIGTKVALFIEPDKWDLIIVRHADSSFYQHLERPRYDTLKVIELMHHTFKTNIIYMADTLPLSLLKDIEENHIEYLSTSGPITKTPLNIIPLSSHVVSQSSLLTEETLKIIHETINQQKKVMLIHERKEDDTDSNYLNQLGIESLTRELEEYDPYLITSDTSKLLEVFKAFQEKGKILIGTSILLNLDEINQLGAIIFVKWDDFLIDSSQGPLKSYSVLSKASNLLTKTNARLIVQTYEENHNVFTQFNDSQVDFATQELQTAKELNLPPFQDMAQIILESGSIKDLEFYSKSAINYLKKALRDHAQILGPRYKNSLSIITIKSDDLDPYRSSLRSLIQAFHDDIKIELRTHQFII